MMMVMVNRGLAFWFFVAAAAVAMLPSSAFSERINVGDSTGWTTWENSVNYTEWASRQKIYAGDWLYFKFDKIKYNVLEVNMTSFETCNDQGFLKNITRGGRDVYELKEARPYYFLSGGGYCWQGLKLAINVSKSPPTLVPTPAAVKSGGTAAAQPLVWAVVASAFSALIWLPGF